MTSKHKRRYRRETADRVYSEFLDRIKIVNSDDHYLYGIDMVVVFGSYLGTDPMVGDIDIAIRHIRKIDDNDAFNRASRDRVKEAKANGRNFTSWFKLSWWSFDELHLFLRKRSPILSLHHYSIEREILEKPETKTSYLHFNVEKIIE